MMDYANFSDMAGGVPPRGEYPWLQGHPKAGHPPKGVPKRVHDVDARLQAKCQADNDYQGEDYALS